MRGIAGRERRSFNVGGTEKLRQHLRAKIRVRSLIQIAEEINDAVTTDANRATAETIAARMAGDQSLEVAASIAKTLIGGFSCGVNREVHDVSRAMLEAFLDGGDLPAVTKARLAGCLPWTPQPINSNPPARMSLRRSQ